MRDSASRGFAGSYKVDTFDLEELPTGRVSRLLVRVMSDPLGRPMRIPVMVARGERPGPVFGITAAVHGEEINGIPVIHRLMQRVNIDVLRGTIVAVVVVNLPGFFANDRRSFESADLNQTMPGRADGGEAAVYAFRLVDRIVRHFDYLVDLHTASNGRANSLYIRADLSDPATARMARLHRPQIILHNPPTDGTLRGAAEALGVPAITVEIGNPQRFQYELIRRTLAGIRAGLSDVGMYPKRKLAPPPATPIICSSSRWLYTDHGGLLDVLPAVTDRVEEGQVIGRLANIFGDVVREFRAPEDGVVIGKSVNPVGFAGARIMHLGRIAGPDWQPPER